jgi:four helix bundle protein
MSNVAEGFESRTPALLVDFLGRAKGSAGELRSQSYVALDAGYIDRPEFEQLIERTEQCSRQLSRFMTSLASRRVGEDGASYEV